MMKAINKIIWVQCLSMGCMLVGCDSAVDENYQGQPLAVIHGKLRQAPGMQLPENITLGFFWSPPTFTASLVNPPDADLDFSQYYESQCVDDNHTNHCDGSPFVYESTCKITTLKSSELTDLIESETDFPLKFRIPVYRLPPSVAHYDLSRQGGQGSIAFGTLVGFVDQNHNGMYDFGTIDTQPEPPLVMSGFQDYIPEEINQERIRKSIFLIYLNGLINLDNTTGEPYTQLLAELPQGYSLWLKTEKVDRYGNILEVSRQIAPVTTEVELTTQPEVAGAREWCLEHISETESLATLPENAIAECSQAGRRISWQDVWRSIGLCRVKWVFYTACLDPSDLDPPADWPCVLE